MLKGCPDGVSDLVLPKSDINDPVLSRVCHLSQRALEIHPDNLDVRKATSRTPTLHQNGKMMCIIDVPAQFASELRYTKEIRHSTAPTMTSVTTPIPHSAIWLVYFPTTKYDTRACNPYQASFSNRRKYTITKHAYCYLQLHPPPLSSSASVFTPPASTTTTTTNATSPATTRLLNKHIR
ncbi:hypothetical protein E2C01_004185 [Portunus trituberculatus]|uniref:Uncharacterized protein n=1 Tax=Portunus trituberculatus TaxID=210409 RepID=A0A5B7CQY4_PORTR|nr:hypothetical protein [Portunus trituberculatus]